MKTKYLLFLGFLIPIVFWSTLFICAWMFDEYNHLSRLVSELGAIGTVSQYVFTTGLILCSLLSILFVIGLYRVCSYNNISIIPVLLILTFTFSIAGAGLFPLPLELHGILGMPSVLLILSPITALVLWGGKSIPGGIKLMSVLSLLIMSLGFLAFFPDVLSNFIGIKQRFFHLGWSVWFVYLSYSFFKLKFQKSNN